MRTFAEKPKATQEAPSAKSVIPSRAHFGHRNPASSLPRLQGTIGDQVVQRLLEASASKVKGKSATGIARFRHDFSCVPLDVRGNAEVQRELTLPARGEVHEQEADRAAKQVMRIAERKLDGSEQQEGSSSRIEQVVSRKAVVGASGSFNQKPNVQTKSNGNDQALSAHDRVFFERHFGHDFSQVRIHADARSTEATDALNADAFTIGHDIYFHAGKLRAQNTESAGLLAHELAHVVQQSRMPPVLQPKLKITGKPGDVSRAMALLNGGLFGYTVSVDKSGNVSISTNKVLGPPTAQQLALANRLTTVINDPKDVIMTVSAGSKTLGGSYAAGDFDIADLETYGVPGLIHEIEEQYRKQVKGQAYGSSTTGAHSEAIKAESEVRGAKRGADKVTSSTANADGTLDLVIETSYTFPNGTIKTMTMTIKSNNIVSVTWK